MEWLKAKVVLHPSDEMIEAKKLELGSLHAELAAAGKCMPQSQWLVHL